MRLAFAAIAAASLLLPQSPAAAQVPETQTPVALATVQVRVFSEPAETTFRVDGTTYRGSVTFNWQEGSKHILEADQTIYGVLTSFNTRYNFGGWSDEKGLLATGTSLVQTITAAKGTAFFKVSFSTEHRVNLLFFNNPLPTENAAGYACSSTPGGTEPAGPNSTGAARPGVVFLNGACYASSVSLWMNDKTELLLNAFPAPGFVFRGWMVGEASDKPNFMTRMQVNGPTVLSPRFEPGKRITFLTDPYELEVSVDDTVIPTLTPDSLLGPTPSGVLDFAEGTTIKLGAPSPQMDRSGRLWVFDKFDLGTGQNTMLRIADVNIPQVIRARFLPGVGASFLTNPVGLPLLINNETDRKSYDYVWGVGTVHTISAPTEVSDARGRRYRFVSWSNGGPQTQQITVPAELPQGGLRLIANYALMPQLVISSSQVGVSVSVDGELCSLPCTVARPAGTTVQISAPLSLNLNMDSRAEFVSWADGGSSAREFVLAGDTTSLRVNYKLRHAIRLGANPLGTATFELTPPSTDGFFDAGSNVQIVVKPAEGFRFRRWRGTFDTAEPETLVTVNRPFLLEAQMDALPPTQTAQVRSAAGDRPDPTVAPGSIISLLGKQLAPATVTGPANPLAQVLANTTVRWEEQFLPLVLVSPEQINAQLPSNIPDGEHKLLIQTARNPEIVAKVQVARIAPGLFQTLVKDQQILSATRTDGSAVTVDRPARIGETILLYGTGFGMHERPTFDGFAALPAPVNPVLQPVTLRSGERVVPVESVFATPGLVGVVTLRVRVDAAWAVNKSIPLTVTVAGVASNTAFLPVDAAPLK